MKFSSSGKLLSQWGQKSYSSPGNVSFSFWISCVSVSTVLVNGTAVTILKVISHVLSFPSTCIKKPIHLFTCMGNRFELKLLNEFRCRFNCIAINLHTNEANDKKCGTVGLWRRKVFGLNSSLWSFKLNLVSLFWQIVVPYDYIFNLIWCRSW